MTKPNLLILMVDQMQAQLLDPDPPAHARIDLPHLRALATRSTQFTNAYCPAPICTPCRASFMLGETVTHHGVIGNDRTMPADRRTLADRLNSAGYHTSYVGKWHLDSDSSRGWSEFDNARSHVTVDIGNEVMRGPDAPHEGVAPYGEEEHLDGVVARLGREQLEALSAGSDPYALMVSFYGPHAPYFLPENWHRHIGPDDLPLPDDFDSSFENRPEIQHRFRSRAWGKTFSEAKWRRIRAAYFSYCCMIDHFIGGLLKLADLKNTVVVFVSDHGEMNGHHRMIYKGPMMYDQLVRVPALLHLPGQTEGCTRESLISITDLTATLLGLSGGEAVPDGQDLRRAKDREFVTSEFYEANWVSPTVEQRVAMIRDATHKLVVTEGQGEELYTVQDEIHNRVRTEKETARALRRILSHEVPWVGEP